MSPEVALVVPAYLLGTFPTATLVARERGHDPEAEGSGNPGASNVYRLAGRRAGAIVFAGDVAKGAAATAAGYAVGGRPLAAACGAAAVLGHVFPATRRFKGGKGVATALGVGAALWPVPTTAAIGAWLAGFKASRGTASVGSIAATVTLPVGVVVTRRPGWEVATAVGLAALVLARHAGNVKRLVGGEERTVYGDGR